MKKKTTVSEATEQEIALTEAAVKDARKQVRNQLGEQLAAKASKAFCLAFAQGATRFAGAERMVGAGESMVPSAAKAIVVEFAAAPNPASTAATAALVGAESEVRKKLNKVLEDFKEKSGADALVSAHQLIQQTRIKSTRDEFYRRAGSICNEIERGARGHFRPGPEALASPTTPSAVTEICWLNGAVRTWVDPMVLSEIAADSKIERIDLPRRLMPDIQVTGDTVGAIRFRARTKHNGKGVIIAVIDSEVALRHPAFKDRLIQKQNYTLELWGNPDPHGTAVAGIAAGHDTDFMGIAPEAIIYNYKVLATNRHLAADDFGGSLAIQQALEDGAHIANCSWGAGPAGDGTSREARACNTAWNHGLIIVKSAGNSGPDAASLTSPADADGVIVVGATDRTGAAMQDYSSRGPTGHGKARPHLVAPGGTSQRGIDSCLVGGGFGDCGNGTSFAAPHVSGLLALMLEDAPDSTPDEIREKLLTCCKSLGNKTNIFGSGLVVLE